MARARHVVNTGAAQPSGRQTSNPVSDGRTSQHLEFPDAIARVAGVPYFDFGSEETWKEALPAKLPPPVSR
jgi:hypothetical protein